MPSSEIVRRIHGVALVLFGALIPVGEGAAFAALALVFACLLWRWRELELRALLVGPAGGVHLGLLVWLVSGLAAVLLGGQGWLKPSELGLWSPLLVIPVLILSARLVEARWLERAAAAFVLALAVAAAYGLVQFLLDARPGEELFRFSSTRTGQMAIPGGKGGTVAGGFFFHRLKMAHILVLGIGVLFVRQLWTPLTPRRRLLEGALLALTGAALVLTYTRGALLAAGFAAAACVPFASRRIRWLSVVALLVAGAAVMAVPSVRQRVVSAAGAEASGVRAFIWAQGMRIVADHPLGTGVGNYSPLVSRYYDLVDAHFDVRTYPHNIVLAALAEAGPVGAAGYLWAWAVALAAFVAALRRGGGGAAVAAAGLFGVAAFWAIGVTHDVLFHKPVSLAFSALVGWGLARLPPGPEPAVAAPAGRLEVALLTVAAALPAAWLSLAADLPRGWLVALAVAGLVTVVDRRWAAALSVVVLGGAVFVAGLSAPWSAWSVAAAGVAIGALALSTRSAVFPIAAAGGVVPLLVVAWALHRGAAWPGEAGVALAVAGSFALAGAVALAVGRLAHSGGALLGRRVAAAALGIGALAGALQVGAPTAAALPAWRWSVARLDPPAALAEPAARIRLLAQLARLRAAGVAEAGWAWAGLALRDNAGPEALRPVCQASRRGGQLDEAWRGLVELGRAACALVDAPGRADLEEAAASEPAVARLRGDLLAEAGDLSGAVAAYRAAHAGGDAWALRDAVQAALAAEAPAAVADLPVGADPLARLWLAPETDTPASWAAWNDALAFGRLGPISRAGVVAVGRRGELKPIHGDGPSYLAVTSRTDPRLAFRVRLPLPPGGQAPGSVRARFRNRYGFRVYFSSEQHGTLVLACDVVAPAPGQRVIRLQTPACAGVWDEVRLELPADYRGPLRETFLQGEFDLALFELAPPPGPVSQ